MDDAKYLEQIQDAIHNLYNGQDIGYIWKEISPRGRELLRGYLENNVTQPLDKWREVNGLDYDSSVTKPIGIDSGEFHFHNPVQHRDGKPPWCKSCGLTKDYEKPIGRFDRSISLNKVDIVLPRLCGNSASADQLFSDFKSITPKAVTLLARNVSQMSDSFASQVIENIERLGLKSVTIKGGPLNVVHALEFYGDSFGIIVFREGASNGN